MFQNNFAVFNYLLKQSQKKLVHLMKKEKDLRLSRLNLRSGG